MKEELESIQKIYNLLIEFVMNYSFQILGAIIIILLGIFVAKKVALGVQNLCEKNNLDVTLTKFVVNIVKFSIIIGTSIVAMGKIGITLTPFIAGIGALSLGAGLALQGTLSNYGAGLAIIITRPFIVGNTITVKEIFGVVEEIRLGYTILSTEDGEEITIPNKFIIGEVLVNSFEHRIVEAEVGIAYDSDVETAIDIIRETIKEHKDLVSKEVKPQVGVISFGDSAIILDYRYWAHTKKYFEVQHKINLAIFKALEKKDILIPYPIRHVYLHDKK